MGRGRHRNPGRGSGRSHRLGTGAAAAACPPAYDLSVPDGIGKGSVFFGRFLTRTGATSLEKLQGISQRSQNELMLRVVSAGHRRTLALRPRISGIIVEQVRRVSEEVLTSGVAVRRALAKVGRGTCLTCWRESLFALFNDTMQSLIASIYPILKEA